MGEKPPRRRKKRRAPRNTAGERLICAAMLEARRKGATCVEHFCCHQCGTPQYAVHFFDEVLKCMECGQQVVSRSPRVTPLGEVTADHLDQAMDLILSMNGEDRHGKDVIPMESCNMEARALLLSKQAAAVREAVSKIRTTAQLLAGNEMTCAPRATPKESSAGTD